MDGEAAALVSGSVGDARLARWFRPMGGGRMSCHGEAAGERRAPRSASGLRCRWSNATRQPILVLQLGRCAGRLPGLPEFLRVSWNAGTVDGGRYLLCVRIGPSRVLPLALVTLLAMNSCAVKPLASSVGPTMQTATVASAFSNLAAGPLKEVTTGLLGVAKGMEKFTSLLSKGTGILEAAKLVSGT